MQKKISIITPVYNGEEYLEKGLEIVRPRLGVMIVAVRDMTSDFMISEGITEIGEKAFFECKDLGTVTFAENSVINKIADNAFLDCSSLYKILINFDERMRA